MEKEFVPYELALRMKQLGFDEPCFGLYAPPSKTVFLHQYGSSISKEQIDAPLYQQAFRWFREKHSLDGESCRYNLTHSEAKLLGINKTEISHVYIVIINGEDFPELDKMVYYISKEEAELACLEKLIEIVESKSE
jgi:hypothetical protein